jgi:hypothetical protein
MVESDDTRTVDRASERPHSNQSDGAHMSKPSASVPKAKRAVFAFCWASIVLRYCIIPISACPCQGRPDDAQHDLRLIQFFERCPDPEELPGLDEYMPGARIR